MRISDWSSDVCSSDLAMLAMRAHRADDGRCRQAGQSTSCVCVTSATSAPSSVRMRVCHTDRRLPIFTGVASPTSRSEEHTSELQSLMRISYAVFCLKKKKQKHIHHKAAKQSSPTSNRDTIYYQAEFYKSTSITMTKLDLRQQSN